MTTGKFLRHWERDEADLFAFGYNLTMPRENYFMRDVAKEEELRRLSGHKTRQELWRAWGEPMNAAW